MSDDAAAIEGSLAERVRAGDRSAEDDLCRRLYPRIRAFARMQLREPAEAADFAQHAMLAVLEALRDDRIASAALIGPPVGPIRGRAVGAPKPGKACAVAGWSVRSAAPTPSWTGGSARAARASRTTPVGPRPWRVPGRRGEDGWARTAGRDDDLSRGAAKTPPARLSPSPVRAVAEMTGSLSASTHTHHRAKAAAHGSSDVLS